MLSLLPDIGLKKINLKRSKKYLHYVMHFGIINELLENSMKTEYADVAELADAHGSGPCRYCFGGGSNPLIRTNRLQIPNGICFSFLQRDEKIRT